MDKYNVYITAIVTAGVVFVSAIWGTVVILDSNYHGLFDYFMSQKGVTMTPAK